MHKIYMPQHDAPHSLTSLIARIQFNAFTLIYRSYIIGQIAKYLNYLLGGHQSPPLLFVLELCADRAAPPPKPPTISGRRRRQFIMVGGPPLSRDIVSPHKTIREMNKSIPRMESTGIEYPP